MVPSEQAFNSLKPPKLGDRSVEFHQSVLAYKKRNKANLRKQERTWQLEKEQDERQRKPQKSEFQIKASRIAHEISSTAQLLSKLAILAKQKPMFNDNPVEIAELSFLVKRKIYSIEKSLVDLSRFQKLRQNGASWDSSNGTQHSKNVMNMLNTKMKNISGDFKDVLEQRQRMEINNRDRWEKISQVDDKESQPATHAETVATSYNSSNPFMSSMLAETNPEERASNGDGKNEANGLSLPQESQMLLMEEGQVGGQYLQERNQAVETIESTIQEVGSLFQQLASMVQEQGDVIQRIDANVDDIDVNISGAQRELLKYFDRVKSNRWLAVKIFFIIFIFFLVWVLVN